MRYHDDIPFSLSAPAKVALTVLAAIIFWLLVQQYGQPERNEITTAAGLRDQYRNYNDLYFNNKLPLVAIKTTLTDPERMAETECTYSGVCTIRFNLKYTLAARVADETLLHEMCHVRADIQGEEEDHGPKWRSCMRMLDARGAFRRILIDNCGDEECHVY